MAGKKSSTKRTAYVQYQSGEYIGRIILLNQAPKEFGDPWGSCVMIAQRADGYYLSRLKGDEVSVGKINVRDETFLLKNRDIIQVGDIKLQFYMNESSTDSKPNDSDLMDVDPE